MRHREIHLKERLILIMPFVLPAAIFQFQYIVHISMSHIQASIARKVIRATERA